MVFPKEILEILLPFLVFLIHLYIKLRDFHDFPYIRGIGTMMASRSGFFMVQKTKVFS